MTNPKQKLNREALAQQIARGDYEAMCVDRLGQNPMRDDVDDIGRTDWVPARFVEERRGISMGVITFCRADLCVVDGHAYFRDDGSIGLVIDRNLSYAFRPASARLSTREVVSPEVLRARAGLRGVFPEATWNSERNEVALTGRCYVARALNSCLPYTRMLPVALYRRPDAAERHADMLSRGTLPGALQKGGRSL